MPALQPESETEMYLQCRIVSDINKKTHGPVVFRLEPFAAAGNCTLLDHPFPGCPAHGADLVRFLWHSSIYICMGVCMSARGAEHARVNSI